VPVNPVFGTARVLKGLAPARDLHARAGGITSRAARWLIGVQNSDGGWGGGPGIRASVEETAAALSGLSALHRTLEPDAAAAIERGVAWRDRATDGGRLFSASPIGLYFARLWYAEDLHPLIFTAEAMSSSRAGIVCAES
jgi:squalene-hopene/tetraprenyl-beta-curcumene cyclase